MPSQRIMLVALCASALYTGFVALSGFLLGQIFFGDFSVIAGVIGVAGLAASAGAFMLAFRPAAAPHWLMWSSAFGILGVVADAANYYINLAIPGNYYAWALVGPFVACLGFIGVTVGYRLSKPPDEA